MHGIAIIVFGICVASEVFAVDEVQCSAYDWQLRLLSKVIGMDTQLANVERKLAAQQEVRPVCDDDWTAYQSACYLFSDKAKTFADAEYFCNTHEGHLVSIRTPAENDFIERQIAVREVKRFWIGMTDIQEEGVWRWIDRDDTADFPIWTGTEPNGVRAENCAVRKMNEWIDVTCSQLNRPICKKTYTTSTTVNPAN